MVNRYNIMVRTHCIEVINRKNGVDDGDRLELVVGGAGRGRNHRPLSGTHCKMASEGLVTANSDYTGPLNWASYLIQRLSGGKHGQYWDWQ